MKLLAPVALASLLCLSVACERSSGDAQPSVTVKVAEPAASKVAATGADRAATPTARAEDEGGSCAGEKAGGTCAGEEGEAGGCSQWDAKAAEVARRATPTDAEWVTIAVKGMSCGGCERRIVANLGQVDGILGVEADAELGQVRVAYAKGNDRMSADARARIAALGYKLQ
jgi:copper chaperone CopZ